MVHTIILDTSFAIWLDQMETHCRKHPKLGIPPGKMPMDGLDHLMEKGCTIVMPNEVLKEMTNLSFGRIGMGMEDDGTPYLRNKYLSRSRFGRRSPEFLTWLQDKNIAGKVDCFATTEAYLDAAQKGDLQGHLCLVADRPPAIGKGVERTEPHERIDGDTEIVRLCTKHLERLPQEHVLTLAHDHGLTGTLAALGEKCVAVHGYSYFEMLSLSGFVDDFRLFPSVVDALPGRGNEGAGPSRLTPCRSGAYGMMHRLTTEWGLNRFQPDAGHAGSVQGRRDSGSARDEGIV